MSISSSLKRVALITGGNKGIGYQAVSQLASAQPDLTVLLTARSASLGEAAVAQLALPNVKFLQLDVTDAASVDKAVAHVQATYGGLDILCNNAGVFDRANDSNGDATGLAHTLRVNYEGLIRAVNMFLPIIRQNGRIVNVASQLGPSAMSGMSADVRARFVSAPTVSALTALIDSEFRPAFLGGAAELKKRGWPNTVYGVSKAAVIVASKILAQENKGKVSVYSACPGWCETDMTSGMSPPLTASEGGSRIVYVLTAPDASTSGAFYEERAVSNWQ